MLRPAVQLLCLLTLLPAINTTAGVLYVDLNSTNAVPPYTNWSTAAKNIQDAVDASTDGDQIIVSNGVYQTGGRVVPDFFLTNRVMVDKPVTIQSVNGPAVTVISGYQVPGVTNGSNATRGIYLAAGATLAGFTITNGATMDTSPSPFGSADEWGGGVYCQNTNVSVLNCIIGGNAAYDFGGGVYRGSLSNCTLAGNRAQNGGGGWDCNLINCLVSNNFAAAQGGGVAGGYYYNCLIIGNFAQSFGGGGVSGGVLINCTVVGNGTAQRGGGTYGGSLRNCIVYFNTAGAPEFDIAYGGSGSDFSYCCTPSVYGFGAGNMTNAPGFINTNLFNFRLSSNSPCINSGNNASAFGLSDLDGNTRIAGGTVDIGAHEFPNPGSMISFAWLQQYGFATDGSADFQDPDLDAMKNWQEWRAGTIPTNSLSLLKLLDPVRGGSNVVVTWQSVTNHLYYLQVSDGAGPTMLFQPLATNIVGQAGTTFYTDQNAAGSSLRLYRVGVQ